MKRLFTTGFDISGNSMFRVIKFGLLNKCIPLGNFNQGPGLRPACTLLFLHTIGKPVFWFAIRFQHHLHHLHHRLLRK